MASPMVKFISETLLNTNFVHCPCFMIVRYSSKRQPRKKQLGTIKHRNIIASSCESLSARGFLRSYKPYKPTENVRQLVLGFCNQTLGSNYDKNTPLSREDKYTLLNKCFEELNYGVPNSVLHKIISISDIIDFYETPVNTTVPFDELKNQDLPPNLHIQYDYVRFDPETDTKFKGISAFPRSSTIVTGIKYREKYKGFTAKSPFLDTEAYVMDEP